MTYCLGITVEEGIVLVADTRMTIGPGDISTYRKLHLLEHGGERIIAIAASGNLYYSQAVVNLLVEGLGDPVTGKLETIKAAPTMFRAAQMIGRTIRFVRGTDAGSYEAPRTRFDVSILLAGQIAGDEMRLFMVYPAGNFIESGTDGRFLQIGEYKFGRSILNRAITHQTDLYDSLKIGLISMTDVIDSNLEVGLPIDLIILRRDTYNAELIHRIELGEPYYHDLRERWSAALRRAASEIPPIPYFVNFR